MVENRIRPEERLRFTYDQIVSGLFQGSAPDEGEKLKQQGFSILVLCAEEHQPESRRFPGLEAVIHAPNDDNGLTMSPSERSIALRAAALVARYVRDGKNVLVTCRAGRNRSGLVVALALHIMTGKSGRLCLERVRKFRQDALIGGPFVKFLESLPAKSRLVTHPEAFSARVR